MKKFILLAACVAALISFSSCERLDKQEPKVEFIELNEATEGTIPVRLSIGNPSTKLTEDWEEEAKLKDLELWVYRQEQESSGWYSDKIYLLDDCLNVIVNIKEDAQSYRFVIRNDTNESGERADSLSLDAQLLAEKFFVTGSIEKTIDELKTEAATHVIPLKRYINKVTVNKISLKWDNPAYKDKKIYIDYIYLMNVPRYLKGWGYQSGYLYFESKINGALIQPEFYFLYGSFQKKISGYTIDNQNIVNRIPQFSYSFLFDEPKFNLSEESPYTGKHVFYAYICPNNILNEAKRIKDFPSSKGLVLPQTLLCIQATVDGETMYYRFPILDQDNLPKDFPTNTHYNFKELVIRDLGSPDIFGETAFKSATWSLQEWKLEDIDEPVEAL